MMLALSIDISSLQHPSNKPSNLISSVYHWFSSFTQNKTKTNIKPNPSKKWSRLNNSVIMKDGKIGNKYFLIKNGYKEDWSWITRIHLGKKARYGGLESPWWGNGDRQISGVHWSASHPRLPAMFQASAGAWHIHTKGVCMFPRNDIQSYSLAHHTYTYTKLQKGWDIEVHTCNFSTQNAKAGGFM